MPISLGKKMPEKRGGRMICTSRQRLSGRRGAGLLVTLLLAVGGWSETATFRLIKIAPTDAPLRFSSPTLVDLDNNPATLEIVVGDESGNVYGFDSLGNRMWQFSIRNFRGFEGVWTACQSSPAVADLDNDGKKEVAVTLASRDEFLPYKPGAFFMFRLDGAGRNPTVAGGFARLARDFNYDWIPDGCFASPTVADLDGDGDLEIITTSWDQTCAAFHHTGALAWNLKYDPTDTQAYGFPAGDTIWTTPAVADIDSNGVKEVVFGADAHLFGWGNQIPFQMQPGGILIVLHGPSGLLNWAPAGQGKFFIESYHPEGDDWYYNPNGENHIPVANTVVRISEVLQSSPVIGDVDGDGRMEIVHGTGQNFYHPADANHNRVYCWNGESATLQWSYYLGSEVFASPALANVDNDPDLEVFVRDFNEWTPRLWGFKGNSGAVLPGFPPAIKPGNPRAIGAVIGDVDGDGRQEIITLSYGRVHVFNSGGLQESCLDPPNALFTSPAIGDIESDGQCEMIVCTSNGLYIYRCNGKVGAIPWGQYRRDAQKSGVVPVFDATPASLLVVGNPLGGGTVNVQLTFHNLGSAVWSSKTVKLHNDTAGWYPADFQLPTSAWVPNARTLTMTVPLRVPTKLGSHLLSFRLQTTGGSSFGQPARMMIYVRQLLTGATHWNLYR